MKTAFHRSFCHPARCFSASTSRGTWLWFQSRSRLSASRRTSRWSADESMECIFQMSHFIWLMFISLQVFDFELTEDEMKTILGFNRNWRVCPMQWWDHTFLFIVVILLVSVNFYGLNVVRWWWSMKWFPVFSFGVQEHSPQGLSIPRRLLRDGRRFVRLQFGVLYVCRCFGFASHSPSRYISERNSDVDNHSNVSASCSSFLLSSQHRLFQELDLGEYIVKINRFIDLNLEQCVL